MYSSSNILCVACNTGAGFRPAAWFPFVDASLGTYYQVRIGSLNSLEKQRSDLSASIEYYFAKVKINAIDTVLNLRAACSAVVEGSVITENAIGHYTVSSTQRFYSSCLGSIITIIDPLCSI